MSTPTWQQAGNLRGPQGLPGVGTKGDKGDIGPAGPAGTASTTASRSTTGNSIAIGQSKTFYTTTPLTGVEIGARMRVVSRADPANRYMLGNVTAINNVSLTSPYVTILTDTVMGSGSFSDWSLMLWLPGEKGATGETGPAGPLPWNDRGVYSDTATYFPNDAVSHEGGFYRFDAVVPPTHFTTATTAASIAVTAVDYGDAQLWETYVSNPDGSWPSLVTFEQALSDPSQTAWASLPFVPSRTFSGLTAGTLYFVRVRLWYKARPNDFEDNTMVDGPWQVVALRLTGDPAQPGDTDTRRSEPAADAGWTVIAQPGTTGFDGKDGADGDTPWAYQGEFSASTNYDADSVPQVVRYQGELYILRTGTQTGGNPAQGSNWQKFLDKGLPGRNPGRGAYDFDTAYETNDLVQYLTQLWRATSAVPAPGLTTLTDPLNAATYPAWLRPAISQATVTYGTPTATATGTVASAAVAPATFNQVALVREASPTGSVDFSVRATMKTQDVVGNATVFVGGSSHATDPSGLVALQSRGQLQVILSTSGWQVRRGNTFDVGFQALGAGTWSTPLVVNDRVDLRIQLSATGNTQGTLIVTASINGAAPITLNTATTVIPSGTISGSRHGFTATTNTGLQPKWYFTNWTSTAVSFPFSSFVPASINGLQGPQGPQGLPGTASAAASAGSAPVYGLRVDPVTAHLIVEVVQPDSGETFAAYKYDEVFLGIGTASFGWAAGAPTHLTMGLT